MPGFLNNAPVSDEKRREHDRHRTWVVAAVLATLAVYLYLFTPAAHVVGLPLPGEVATHLGLYSTDVFDDSGVVECEVTMSYTDRLGSTENELLVFFLVVAATFVVAYYLPLPYKQPAILIGALFALIPIYGPRNTAALLAAHALVHQVFHPTRDWTRLMLPGLLAAVAFAPWDFGRFILWLAVLAPALALFYRAVLLPLLKVPALDPWIRGVVAHTALIGVVSIALWNGLSGNTILLVAGIILFFRQWPRLVLYHVDYQQGKVPRNTSLARYLAVFLTPGAIAGTNWGVELGLGYDYTTNRFLAEDKNKIVMSGVKLLWVALIYLVLGDWLRELAADGFEALGIRVYGTYIVWMVDDFMRGANVSPASVWATSLLDTIRWSIWFVGIVHVKTAIWRIYGYAFESYFNKPWMATNLVVFWARYTLYYREFLLRTFYYPVFLNFFRGHAKTRIIIATLAAASFGNMFWRHIDERMYYQGTTFPVLLQILHTWPYFLLLGLGIAGTAVYLLKTARKKRRRAWTPGPKLALDVLAAFCTFQYYSVIHVFARPSSGSSEWDLFRLVLRGFGIHS